MSSKIGGGKMALVKCPDCEKMVSPRVEVCPFCGCPAKFFEPCNENELDKPDSETDLEAAQEDSQMEKEENEQTALEAEPKQYVAFQFSGMELRYSLGIEQYAKMFGAFLQAGDDAYFTLSELYDKAEGISKALETVPDKAYEKIASIIDFAARLLYDNGINVTPEQFYQKYNRTYPMDYAGYYSSILEKYSEIRGAKQELAAYREAEKASRARWSGGGFGVKGAIKGAVTASAMNMGSDFLHSFGDSAQRSNDEQKFAAQFRNLYQSDTTKSKLCYSVKICIMNVFTALTVELNRYGYFEEVFTLDREKADTLYDTTLKYEQNDDVIFRNMLQCIYYYPGERRFYQKIQAELMNDENNLEAFLKFWNIEYLLQDMVQARKAQDEFAAFLEENGIQEFDFSDLSSKNAGEILRLLRKYRRQTGKSCGKEMPATGEYSIKIQKYLKTFEQTVLQWDYSLYSWISKDATMEDFWTIVTEGSINLFGSMRLSEFSRSDSYQKGRKLYELDKDGDAVLLCCDTSIMGNCTKGIAITRKFTIDLKTNAKIENCKMKSVGIVQAGSRNQLQFSDGEQNIFLDAANTYSALILPIFMVRYTGSSNLYETSMGDILVEKSEVFDRVEGYFPREEDDEEIDKRKAAYLDVVNKKNKYGSLFKANVFRRNFKLLRQHDKDGIINCYDFEIEDAGIKDKLGELSGQYVMYCNADVIVTDQNFYLGKEKFSLEELKELLYFTEIAVTDVRALVVHTEDGKLHSFGIKPKNDELERVFMYINVALEGAFGKTGARYSQKELYWCKKCQSFNIKQLLIRSECIDCGNKKMDGFYKGFWNGDKQHEVSRMRHMVCCPWISLETEKSLFYDENRHYEWILEWKPIASEEETQEELMLMDTASSKEEQEIEGMEAAAVEENPYKFCVFCGKKIQRTAKFCNFCGSKI